MKKTFWFLMVAAVLVFARGPHGSGGSGTGEPSPIDPSTLQQLGGGGTGTGEPDRDGGKDLLRLKLEVAGGGIEEVGPKNS